MGRPLGGGAEHKQHGKAERLVKHPNQAHHDEHEHQHDNREVDQLFAGGSDDLAELGEHLANEQRDTSEGVALFGALLLR